MAANPAMSIPEDYFVTSHQFTKTTHRDVYRAIDPTSPKLSQKGKTVIIAGGGRGIGKAIAHAFAQAGASNIVLVGRGSKTLEETAESLQKTNSELNVIPVSTDITSEESVNELEETIRSKVGTPDILVNAAGSWQSAEAIAETKPDQWWGDFEVNLKGSYLAIRAYLRLVGPERNATIINLVSWGMLTNGAVGTSYAISKLAMYRLSEAVPAAYPKVKSMSFHPGMVKTDMAHEHPEVLHFCGDTPELAAGTAVYLATPQAHFLSGRYMSANWDVTELESRQAEILSRNLLRMDLKGEFGATVSSPPFKTVTMYPVKDGAEFDMHRMVNEHMPLAMDRWGKYGLMDWEIMEFDKFGQEERLYYAQLVMTWRDAECPGRAMTSPEAAEVIQNIVNFVPVFGVSMSGKVVASK